MFTLNPEQLTLIPAVNNEKQSIVRAVSAKSVCIDDADGSFIVVDTTESLVGKLETGTVLLFNDAGVASVKAPPKAVAKPEKRRQTPMHRCNHDL